MLKRAFPSHWRASRSYLRCYDDSRIVYRDEAKEEGIKSMLVVPIVVRNKIMGIMRLLTDEYRNFTQDEMDFAVALAEQGG